MVQNVYQGSKSSLYLIGSLNQTNKQTKRQYLEHIKELFKRGPWYEDDNFHTEDTNQGEKKNTGYRYAFEHDHMK